MFKVHSIVEFIKRKYSVCPDLSVYTVSLVQGLEP